MYSMGISDANLLPTIRRKVEDKNSEEGDAHAGNYQVHLFHINDREAGLTAVDFEKIFRPKCQC